MIRRDNVNNDSSSVSRKAYFRVYIVCATRNDVFSRLLDFGLCAFFAYYNDLGARLENQVSGTPSFGKTVFSKTECKPFGKATF